MVPDRILKTQLLNILVHGRFLVQLLRRSGGGGAAGGGGDVKSITGDSRYLNSCKVDTTSYLKVKLKSQHFSLYIYCISTMDILKYG